AGAALVFLEVVDEQPGELPGRRVVGRLVRPGVARPQDFRGDAGTRGDHLETEHGITLRPGAGQSAAGNRVQDGAGVRELDRFTHAVPAAAPARVDQPDAGVVLFHFRGQQLRILARVPHQERAAETRREGGRRLLHADLGAGDLGRVA